MLAELVIAFEEEGFVDVLGDIYMSQNFGDNHKGQYFSPYDVCQLMAKMTSGNLAKQIKEQGYISVNDCCCSPEQC